MLLNYVSMLWTSHRIITGQYSASLTKMIHYRIVIHHWTSQCHYWQYQQYKMLPYLWGISKCCLISSCHFKWIWKLLHFCWYCIYQCLMESRCVQIHLLVVLASSPAETLESNWVPSLQEHLIKSMSVLYKCIWLLFTKKDFKGVSTTGTQF